MPPTRFALLIPVKPGTEAKSRLGFGPSDRVALREAFVRDTVAAAAACPLVEVYVVGDGSAVPSAAALPDEGNGDLNLALTRAADRVAGRDRGVAALLADLPCLTPDDLATALGSGQERFFVADAAGTGTTLLAAAPGAALRPEFGFGSAARHAASGAVAVTAPLPSLRVDVDTADDLARAIELGVGEHTRAALARLQG